ncbi:biotin--acetyl-CoA-carboxylase ligase [Methanocaldococcus villosus KIN24-T80]|uniref:Biotin--acetyl-CoA-carboxylase ligase n=1 Tax=Methanocaldococcus villosus KIN24-T80 TaxID=1069083 RepID=N6UVW3_9EURY|nr:biotin--[acetyl-CoA-carboxylase] ligase [Methanocaldococcus villosus]ENN96469.1 biotin--acetyl-CoA-carboxylase ligase [Methanocaldococcus villosus KIN24-T80]
MKIVYLKEVDSTNDFAKKLIDNGDEAIIIAERQSKGKGRLGRIWISEEGGLYFTIILKGDPEFINFLSAVSVVETLRQYNINSGIKFPNDICVDEKKLCGVLIEIYKGYVILGIGINVNNDIKIERAVSLKSLGYDINKFELLFKFLKIFFENMKKDKEKILETYKKYSITINRPVKILLPNKIIYGKVVDIDYSGIMLDIGNKIINIPAGDVIHLRFDKI